MKILTEPITKSELQQMASKMFGFLVKAVIDVERNAMAIDASLHVDLAEMLVEEGSKGNDLWGINIHPDATEDDWIEFDSMINLKPQLKNKSRGVEDPALREKIKSIASTFIKL